MPFCVITRELETRKTKRRNSSYRQRKNLSVILINSIGRPPAEFAPDQTQSAKIASKLWTHKTLIFILREKCVMNFKFLPKIIRVLSGRIMTINLVVVLALIVASTACKSSATPAATTFTPVADAPPQNSYADVVSKVAPAVITIRANKRVRTPQQFPFSDDPFFRGLFGNRTPQQQPQETLEQALGSGVIVSADGYILTNHHVIDGAQDIKVDMNDGRTLDAKLVGSDPPSDLALLKISGSGLSYLTLGDSDKVRIGDVVLAIGNPLNVGQTVTMGIISAKGRSNPAGSPGSGNFEDFLQTDAPINHGNSGGALINTVGELIGINSQIAPGQGGGNIGIGFAIPSNMARTVMEQLEKNGKVRRGQLGITVRRVDSDMATSLGMSETKGVIVNSVKPGSAAERAGIHQGDVITAIDGTPVNDSNAFRNRVAGTGPGNDVTLTILRDNREQKIKATLGEFAPENNQSGEQGNDGGQEGSGEGKLGMTVIPLTPEIISELNLRPGTQGVVVESVDPAGPAVAAGIQRGDVIQEVNRQAIHSAADLRSAIDKNGNKPALILINRRGDTVYLTVRPKQ
jgi:Do/DeqQ family serine protease